MNLLFDESVDRPVVDRLRKDGHTVFYIGDMNKGMPDHEVLDHANKNASLLVTLDKDFGDLVFRKKLVSSGVLLLRLDGLTNIKKAEIVSLAVNSHAEQLWNAFTVVTEKTIRIRKYYFNTD